jgi:V8-like Glu-specific endopeptidase
MWDTSTRVFIVVMDRFKLHAVVQQVYVQSQRTFEFQVQLQSRNSHSCGGAIFSDNLVVTARHCVDRYVCTDRDFYHLTLYLQQLLTVVLT